jgi:catechol 2,3-dioxygenase-like lactoylglutathione lyase family enzyme
MERSQMNWTLEVVLVPVSDVDRAISFYADKLGFNIDHDTKCEPRGPIRSTDSSWIGLLDRPR